MAVTDLRAFQTVVSSSVAGTNIINVDNASGFQVNDKIIIESLHGYNESGVDGVWSITNMPSSGYYWTAQVGKSWMGTITNIVGNTLTLSRAVPNSSTGLTVYRDNHDAIPYAIENNIKFPEGQTFACNFINPIRPYLTNTFKIIDFNYCTILAPRGCGAALVTYAKVGGGGLENKVWRNLTIQGNARDSGYGFQVETGVYYQGSSMSAAFVMSGANHHVENMVFKDNWRSIGGSYLYDSTISNCISRFDDPLRAYIQWEYYTDLSQRVTFDRCIMDSNYVRPAFEAFKSSGIFFNHCVGRNGPYSSNSSGAIRFEDCSIIWDEENPHSSFSQYNPLMNLNRIIENQGGANNPIPNTDGGLKIKNMKFDYRKIPYPNTNAIFNCINISGPYQGNTPVRAIIDGIELITPRNNLVTPNAGYMLRSDPNDTVASNFTGPNFDTGFKYWQNGVNMGV